MTNGKHAASNLLSSSSSPLTMNGTELGPCAVAVRDLAKRYGTFALEDVSIAVPQGSIVGLVGRNGAGKTTLMKLVMGSVHPDAGTIELFGKDIAPLRDEELAALRQRVAYVGAVTAYPAGMSVRDVCRTYELAYLAFDHDTFMQLCSAMELDATHRRVSELSRGMGMKLQIACALASGASLLLLDEPTSGLDPIVRDELLGILRAWMEGDGRSILISSHITSDLESLADYLVMIDGGRVALSCETDTISQVMGIANLRNAELEDVLSRWPFGKAQARVLDQGLYKALLVPERAAFLRAFPSYSCDRASIDDVMAFVVKGEVRS